MHRFLMTVVACLAALIDTALAQDTTASASLMSVSGCAAVVSTTDVCSTCVTAACVVPATITAGCGGCAQIPPTVYRSFPCDGGCDGLGCKTVYSVVTETGSTCAASGTAVPTSTGSSTPSTSSTSSSSSTPAPTTTSTSDPDDGGDAGETSEEGTSGTSTVSTAGAARVMPLMVPWRMRFKLW